MREGEIDGEKTDDQKRLDYSHANGFIHYRMWKKVVCDLCDEKKSCTVKKIAGETVNICDDCMTELTEE